MDCAAFRPQISLKSHKFYGSEGGLRVPLVVTGPGIAPADIQHALVHVTDLVPTLLEAASVQYDAEDFYGRSVLPVLRGDSETSYTDEESFAFEVSGNAALYRGKWKITRLAAPLGDHMWRLYDLSVDPGETSDLSDENPELFEELKAEYLAYSEEVGVFEVGPDDYAHKQLFRNMLTKSLEKYWAYLIALAICVTLVFFGFIRLVRKLTSKTVAGAPISSQPSA